ncbi:sensor histidine kinase [Sporolactobacillus pectinivorans]|uniref:sensor histidine kinase n=1 Tax=Sporolactobacillus pectinivorans TaxID=1591408 RepID=UPI001EFC711D|nr:HAMP domain-containing sensor histidine kinase [Sporolactobacillus pectinivorans]
MNFWYILTLFLTVLFIGVAVLSIISYQLYKGTEQEVQYVENQLVQESMEKNPDWTDTIANILYDQHPDLYVRIETPDAKTIYSKGSESITDQNSYMIKLSLFSSISFKKKFIPIYHHRASYNGYTFDLYVRMDGIHNYIVIMIRVLALCVILGIVIGSLAIYQLSRRLNRPLMDVTEMIHQVTETRDLKQRVLVADQPREVHDLALSFNQLMNQLDRQIERERRFVSDASHELRTPLSAIRGHVELIQRHGFGHPEVIDRSIHFVDQESKRMQRLIEQLLMIARLDRRSKLLETVNLSMIAKNVIADYTSSVAQHFTADIADGTYALANEDYVHQVLVSLLGNAKKYTPDDGWIKINVNGDHQFSYIRVQNSGPRIPDEEKKKIFTRFYRLDQSRSSEAGGSGLGLAIVKELVELDEGKIWVEDLKPVGSEFIVRLKARTAIDLNA